MYSDNFRLRLQKKEGRHVLLLLNIVRLICWQYTTKVHSLLSMIDWSSNDITVLPIQCRDKDLSKWNEKIYSTVNVTIKLLIDGSRKTVVWACWIRFLFLFYAIVSWHIGVFPKCFHWIQWQNYLSLKGLKPATSCVRDQGATTTPARHMWKTEF